MPQFVTSGTLRDELRSRINYQTRQKDVAEQLGVTKGYLSAVLAGNKEIGPAILKAMGYDPTPHYRKRK